MRRLFGLAAVARLIAATYSSDSDDPEESQTTDAPPTLPGVLLATGGSSVLTDDDLELAAPFVQGDIPISIISSLGEIDAPELSVPEPGTQAPVDLSVSDVTWFVLDGCAFAKAEILMTAISVADAEAIDFPDPNQFESSPSLGSFGNDSIVLAEVPEGSELLNIQKVINSGKGMASFHYPMSPSPRWKYGPATEVVTRATVAELEASQQLISEVMVLDRFDSMASNPNVSQDLQDSTDATRGHGEFIEGILLRLGVRPIPRHVILPADTVASELSVAEQLVGTSDHVTNLSLGTAPCEIDGVVYPPIGVAAAMIKRSGGYETAPPVVASAGNHGEEDECVRPWFPAYFSLGMPAWDSYLDLLDANNVFDNVDRSAVEAGISLLQQTTISVGAAVLAPPGGATAYVRASYSGCDALAGVTEWAPGTNVISDFVDGGLAVWSGTSFAAPQIAAAKALGHM